MNIKCQHCSNNLMSLSRYLFKPLIPKGGLKCQSCNSLNIMNPFVFLIPMLVVIIANGVFLLAQPKYISIPVQLGIVCVLVSVFIIKKPLLLVKDQTPKNHNEPLRWYTSPILYVGILFLVILFYAFK